MKRESLSFGVLPVNITTSGRHMHPKTVALQGNTYAVVWHHHLHPGDAPAGGHRLGATE